MIVKFSNEDISRSSVLIIVVDEIETRNKEMVLYGSLAAHRNKDNWAKLPGRWPDAITSYNYRRLWMH